MQNPLLEIEQRMLGDIYTSREVMDNLEVLCDDCGSRWGGTEGERRAAAFLLERFREYGLVECHLEPFSYTGWVRGPASLHVVAPVERSMPCISLPMSPPATVQGELVYVGDGAPAEFAAVAERLPGGIAMVSSQPPRGLNRTVHRSEKYQRSALGGAAVFLYTNQYAGYGPETGSIASDREALIPGIAIAKEEGEMLLRLQRRHGPLTLRVETSDRTETMTSWNVVADLPGPVKADEWVLLGCHYDGHDISQGAHDPASGTVALVEAARVLALHAGGSLGCGIRCVLFGIEEVGLTGARRYVDAHLHELDQIRLTLNLDSAGGAGPKGLLVNRWPQIEPLVERWATEMAAEVRVGQRTSAFSDHYPFFLEGVPTAMMGNPTHVNTGRGFDHTAFDTLDKVHIGDLREAAASAARLALRISLEEPWPAKRRTHEEVQALLAAEPSLEGQAVKEALEARYAERDAQRSDA
ncbi:MAG TPA: M28 family peptidase [Armatimonadota bacterium]|nr:M28 family peptidase [Armatimonadota bacterium]